MDGQFLLAAAVIAGIGPRLEHHLPNTINLVLLFLIAGAVGAAWTIPPALLKARYELNEIITTLMMTFIGISLAGDPRQGDVPGPDDDDAADERFRLRRPAAVDPRHAIDLAPLAGHPHRRCSSRSPPRSSSGS